MNKMVVCNNCGCVVRRSRKQLVKRFFINLVVFSVLLFSSFSLIVKYSTFTSPVLSKLYSPFSLFMSMGANTQDDDLRVLAINITSDCDLMYDTLEEEQRCQMTHLFYYVSDFSYVLGAGSNIIVYPPEKIIKFKAGDCKNKSYLYSALAYNIGLDVKIKCEKHHCYNMVFINKKTFIVDTTTGRLEML